MFRGGMLGALFVLTALAVETVDPQTAAASRSAARVSRLRHLLDRHFREHGTEQSDFRVRRAVLEQFAQADDCPTAPLGLPVGEGEIRRLAREGTEKLVREEFPPLDEEELRAEAVAKYPIYAEGDLVEVTYLSSPVRKTTVKGRYRGRVGNTLIIDYHRVPLRDVMVLTENEGVSLKFDQDESLRLRELHVEDGRAAYEEKKAAFAERVHALNLAAERKLAYLKNEENGYIRFEGGWLNLPDLVNVLIREARERIEKQRRDEVRRREEQRLRDLQTAVRAQTAFEHSALALTYRDPEQVMASRNRADLERQAAAAKAEEQRRKAEEEKAAAEKAAAAKAAAEQAKAAEEARTAASVAGPERVSIEVESALVPWWFWVVAGGGVIAVIAILAVSMATGRANPAKFFKGRGKLQRSFWESVASDPENVKYVAYRFPSEEDARRALAGLSYMREVTGGGLNCRFDITYGYYPHHDRFVAFVGGITLGYAMWREASALFPELPGAEYFRVSTAPAVALEVPDVEELAANENMNIQHVENREGVGDDYSQYHIYKAPTIEEAQSFLGMVTVKSGDVQIVVVTPEGPVSKSIDGVYQGLPSRFSATEEQ